MAEYLANLIKDLPQERFMKPFHFGQFLGTFQAVQHKEQVKIN